MYNIDQVHVFEQLTALTLFYLYSLFVYSLKWLIGGFVLCWFVSFNFYHLVRHLFSTRQRLLQIYCRNFDYFCLAFMLIQQSCFLNCISQFFLLWMKIMDSSLLLHLQQLIQIKQNKAFHTKISILFITLENLRKFS